MLVFRMEPRPPRNPQRISRRVLGNWEKLVGRAVRTELLGRASYSRDGWGRGSNSGQTGMAPQSLAQQVDIDAVLQAADEIGQENVQVARICKYPANIVVVFLALITFLQYLPGSSELAIRSLVLFCPYVLRCLHFYYSARKRTTHFKRELNSYELHAKSADVYKEKTNIFFIQFCFRVMNMLRLNHLHVYAIPAIMI